MADTQIATGDDAAVKQWDPGFMRQEGKKIFWATMSGKDPNNLVQTKNELTRKPGDKITISLWPRFSGAGVQGEAPIEGFEEQVTVQNDAVTVEMYRQAWRSAGYLTEQRSPADLREEARFHLSQWVGEKVDTLGFTAIESSPSRIYTEISDALVSAGATASVTATDLVEPMMCAYLRAAAQTLSPKVKPIRQGAKDLFVLLLHPHSSFDMKNDSTWQNFHRDADVRDPKDNYLFKAGLGIVDDVLIYAHENVATASNWGGGGVNGVRNKFLGAQAMALAWARFPWMVEKRFEYGSQYGAMVGCILGFKKLTFNANDFGLIELRTARTAITP